MEETFRKNKLQLLRRKCIRSFKKMILNTIRLIVFTPISNSLYYQMYLNKVAFQLHAIMSKRNYVYFLNALFKMHHSQLGSQQYTKSPRSTIRDTPFGSGIEADKSQFDALFLTFFMEICTEFEKLKIGKHIGRKTCIRDKDMKPSKT